MQHLSNQFHSIFLFFMFVILGGYSVTSYAESAPSEGQIRDLYMQRVVADNQASEHFFGKMGTTQFHDLKKVSCQAVSNIESTQACKVNVEITSVGLGKHRLNDSIVLKKYHDGRWRLISGVFN